MKDGNYEAFLSQPYFRGLFGCQSLPDKPGIGNHLKSAIRNTKFLWTL
jgi:hypothetical protein